MHPKTLGAFAPMIAVIVLSSASLATANVLYDESVNGELSDFIVPDPLSPPLGTLGPTENRVSGKIELGGDVDPFNIIIPANMALLVQLEISNYVPPFFGLGTPDANLRAVFDDLGANSEIGYVGGQSNGLFTSVLGSSMTDRLVAVALLPPGFQHSTIDGAGTYVLTMEPVAEPATLSLAAIGVSFLAVFRFGLRRRRNSPPN